MKTIQGMGRKGNSRNKALQRSGRKESKTSRKGGKRKASLLAFFDIL
jgi:hypothetical protein